MFRTTRGLARVAGVMMVACALAAPRFLDASSAQAGMWGFFPGIATALLAGLTVTLIAASRRLSRPPRPQLIRTFAAEV